MTFKKIRDNWAVLYIRLVVVQLVLSHLFRACPLREEARVLFRESFKWSRAAKWIDRDPRLPFSGHEAGVSYCGAPEIRRRWSSAWSNHGASRSFGNRTRWWPGSFAGCRLPVGQPSSGDGRVKRCLLLFDVVFFCFLLFLFFLGRSEESKYGPCNGCWRPSAKLLNRRLPVGRCKGFPPPLMGSSIAASIVAYPSH